MIVFLVLHTTTNCFCKKLHMQQSTIDDTTGTEVGRVNASHIEPLLANNVLYCHVTKQ